LDFFSSKASKKMLLCSALSMKPSPKTRNSQPLMRCVVCLYPLLSSRCLVLFHHRRRHNHNHTNPKPTLFSRNQTTTPLIPVPLPPPKHAAQVGDGTTTVVILAGEFLRECKPFVEDGVHPQNIIKYYRQAAQLAIARVKVGGCTAA
jgi:hypothetical protein